MSRSRRQPPKAFRRVTLRLEPQVYDRIESAVYWTPQTTLTGLMVSATMKEIDRLERKRGRPFQAARAPVKRGRPIIVD